MRNRVESEIKRVKPTAKGKTRPLRKDATMTGGERAETPAQKQRRRQTKRKPREAPIIEKTPEGGVM